MTDHQPDPPGYAKRRHTATLRNMAKRSDHQAELMENSSLDLAGLTLAGELRDEAHAIRWALLQIDPEVTCVGQAMADLQRAGRARG